MFGEIGESLKLQGMDSKVIYNAWSHLRHVYKRPFLNYVAVYVFDLDSTCGSNFALEYNKTYFLFKEQNSRDNLHNGRALDNWKAM